MPPTYHKPWNGHPSDHYAVLGVPEAATPAEIRTAYLLRAKQAHPDRGGSNHVFAAVQTAYETLHDPAARRVYDATRAVAPPIPPQWPRGPAEGILLDVLAQQLHGVDPTKQLVVVCELCSRPSTCTCSSCNMPLCPLCTRTPHWRGAVPLHWPLLHTPGHLAMQLARAEMDMKKLHDARVREAADPHHRTEGERRILRAVRAAAAQAAEGDSTVVMMVTTCVYLFLVVQDTTNQQVWTRPPLSTLYKWCETPMCLYVAVHAPTAFAGLPVMVSLQGRELLLQPHGAAPVLRRCLAHAVDPTCPMHTTRCVSLFSFCFYRLLVISATIPITPVDQIQDG